MSTTLQYFLLTKFGVLKCRQCYSIPKSIPVSSVYPLCLCSCFRCCLCEAVACVQPGGECRLVGPLSEIGLFCRFFQRPSSSLQAYVALGCPHISGHCHPWKAVRAAALPAAADGLPSSESAAKDCNQNSAWWGGKGTAGRPFRKQTLGNSLIILCASLCANREQKTDLFVERQQKLPRVFPGEVMSTH